MSATSNDPTLWSARQQAAAIAAGELGSRELLELFVSRIDDVNPALNAVITFDLDRARAAADDADAAVAAGAELGPLHGLPVTIKDALETEGIRSTGGAGVLVDHVPATNAPAVQAVVDAGAIVFAKTNLPEWSGDIQSHNATFGRSNNPWNVERTPGGSSGGAAATVAVGGTSFEIGTDIGGSVRIPAAFSGICGHKPSHGVIPTQGYLDRPGGGTTVADVNVFGPLTRSIDDLELLVDVMAGPAPDMATAWKLALPPPRHTEPSGLRVAVWADDPVYPVATDVRRAIESAGQALEAAGASIDAKARPELDLRSATELGMLLIGLAASVSRGPQEVDDPSESAAAEDDFGHLRWLAADRRRTEIRAAWADFFTEVDVLLCPVCIVPAFPHNIDVPWSRRQIDVDGVMRSYDDTIAWTSFIGMAYLPSTVIPIGYDAQGMPIGVQIVGPHLEDRTSLAVARMLESAMSQAGYRPPPMVVG